MVLLNTIRIQRAKYQMTQEELARLVGVSRQTIISIERGKYTPSALLAFRIARALETPVEALFKLEEEEDDEK
jgi:putative transcriptional regulator